MRRFAFRFLALLLASTTVTTDEVPLPRVVRFDLWNLGALNIPGKGHPLFKGGASCRTVVDVGAFQGNDYVLLGIRNGHKVIAFEPSGSNVKSIFENIEYHESRSRITHVPVNTSGTTVVPPYECSGLQLPLGHAFVLQAAVTNQTGIGSFYENADVGSIIQGAVPAEHDAKFTTRVAVPFVRLDDVIDEDVWFLKIDVQGNELAVLQGAENLLSKYKIPYLMVEVWPEGMRQTGHSAMMLLDFLHDHGYECHQVYALLYEDQLTGLFLGDDVPMSEFEWRSKVSGSWSDTLTFEEYVSALDSRPSDETFNGYQSDVLCMRRWWRKQLI